MAPAIRRRSAAGGRRKNCRWVPALVAMLASSAPVPAAAEPRGRVVLVGSSSVTDALGDVIAEHVEREGYAVVRRGHPSAGLARPDFRDMDQILSSAPIGPGTDAVLLYVGGNDAQPLWLKPEERGGGRDAWIRWDDQAAWSEVYERRVQKLIDAACARGARRVVVLPPGDVVDAKLQARLERVRVVQERAAAGSKCGRSVATTGDAGELEASKPPLRGPGGVHMTRAGAMRVWGRAGPRVLRLVTAQE
jgi:hypothetical protein